ncbi:hypothetical protein RKD54_004720 [Pseudarthrobacter sp. SLBN-100]|uniref:aromatic-ring hydroxylase C-terminal domain-containing protein n=1 Tax=Arthrobacter sp. SLBN-100 TaxID=2768450 RepID=UPI001359CDC4|nr:hypothetical protein [Arthrobacter sp. SLBN-100]
MYKEVGHEGALLVRPDRYIAWRSMNRPADPTDALRVALSQVLRVNALIPAARV